MFWIPCLLIFFREVGCNAFSDLTNFFLTVSLSSWKWLSTHCGIFVCIHQFQVHGNQLLT